MKEVLTHIAWRQKQLRLPLSRKMARSVGAKLSFSKAKGIVSTVAPLAYRGVITEKIVPMVSKKLTLTQKKKLQSQLSLGYLK